MGNGADDTLLERAEGSALRLWILMRLDRRVLSVGILSIVFAALVGLGAAELGPYREIVEDVDAIQNIFSSMFGPIITGVTLVATIGQLVLSQELGAVGDQTTRMEESMEFRRNVEDEGGMEVSPPEPAAFLREVVESTEAKAERLIELMDGEGNEELSETVTEYAESLDEHAEIVREKLEDSQFGTFDVIWAALDFNYSLKIFQAREIRHDYEDELSEEAYNTLGEAIEMLKLFGPAREHFKTLFFQWELIDLSRALLYASIPALIVTASMLMYVDANTLPGTTMGIDNLVLLTSAAFCITLAPFVILMSYIFRIATVAKRTLAMGPFILRESSRDADSDL